MNLITLALTLFIDFIYYFSKQDRDPMS